MCNRYSCFISLPAFYIVSIHIFFYLRNSNWCKVVFHCGFNFPFLIDNNVGHLLMCLFATLCPLWWRVCSAWGQLTSFLCWVFLSMNTVYLFLYSDFLILQYLVFYFILYMFLLNIYLSIICSLEILKVIFSYRFWFLVYIASIYNWFVCCWHCILRSCWAHL